MGSSPPRPLTIWICIVFLGIMGVTCMLPFVIGLYIVLWESFPDVGIVLRGSIFVPASLTSLASIIPILKHRAWGRWVAVLSAVIFFITFLAIIIFIAST